MALPPKVFETLLVLLRHGGETVTKQELMAAVWPDTFVDEGNLTQNIFLLRKKLGQTAEGEDYIQTLPRRGYRMNVAVRRIDIQAETAKILSPNSQAEVSSSKSLGWPWFTLAAGTAAIMAALVVIILVLRRREPTLPAVSNFVQITHDTEGKRGRTGSLGGPDAALLTDGARLYFTSGAADAPAIWQVSVKGGDPERISVPLSFPQLLDFSPARLELLIAGGLDEVTSRPFWSEPIPAGAAHPIGNLKGRDAAWSPDGRTLAFTRGTELYRSNPLGTEIHKIADLSGLGWRPRWSPDGRRLRLTIHDVATNTNALWEVASQGGNLHPLLPDWNSPASECCGVWAADGRQFVFQATRDGKTDIWALAETSSSVVAASARVTPVQITNGQINSLAPAFSPDGRKLYVIGQQLRGELERYDPSSQQFVSYLGGPSSDFVEFSHDKQWMLYVAYPEGTLWRSRIDGSERLQLTFAPMQVMVPHWSPDDKRIVFRSIGGGRTQAYILSANGGEPQPLEARPGGQMMHATWSPDGKSVMFSDYPFFRHDAQPIHVYTYNLEAKQLAIVPGSEGCFAPVWSPDGRYIVASTIRGSHLLLFDFQTRQWTDVGEGWDFKKWSSDSRSFFFLRHGPHPAIMKMHIGKEHKVEQVASLGGIYATGRLAGLEFSISLDGWPMILRDTGTEEIYSLDWKE